MRPHAMFLVWTCAILWLALAVQGVFDYVTLEPTGDGFTRGFNRFAAFSRWEVYALGVACVAFFIGRGAPKGNLSRFAARWPLYLSGGFFLTLTVLFVLTMIVAATSS